MNFKITELIIYNSNRFNLNNIKKIIYRPSDGLNLIIGTNGSGKSSMLDYLSLFPLDKEDFDKDGYRELKFIYNDIEYIVSTGKYGINKHSFIKDGVELNGGYTRKIYLQLLKDEFNLDNKIWDIITLKKKFILQSYSERGNWFNILTKNNLEYPFNVYNKIKKSARDISGYIKLEKENLNKLIAKQVDKEAIEILKKDLEYLKLIRDNINATINNTPVIENDVISNIDKDIKELKDILSNAYINIDTNIKDTLVEKLNIVKGEINSKVDLLDKFSNSNNYNIKDIEKEIENINNKIDNTLKYISTILEEDISSINIVNNIYSYLNSDYNTINDIISKLKDIDIDTSIVNNSYIDKYNILKEKIDKLKLDIRAIENEIKLIESHKHNDDVECPACKTRFKPFYDASKVNTLLKEKEAHMRRLEGIESTFEYMSRVLSTYEYKNRLLEALKRVLVNLKLLKYIDNLDILDTKINQLLSYKDIVLDTINMCNKLDTLKRDLQLQKSGLKREDIEQDLERLYKLSKELKIAIKAIDKEIENRNRARILYNDLLNNLYRVDKFANNLFLNKIKDILLELLKELELNINNLERQINTIDYLDKQIKDIDSNIKDKEKRLRVLNKVIDILSPKDGLIAESIISLLEYLLDNINDIINDIWEYPLEVLLPDFEEYGLKFNFLLKVNNDKIRKDIAYGSESMQEIINLAFSIAFTEILKLDYLPLYLDEFSSSFDTVHKLKTIDFINKLIHNRQCFMVTHEINQMIEASNRDTTVVVLDNKNLNINIQTTNNILIEYS